MPFKPGVTLHAELTDVSTPHTPPDIARLSMAEMPDMALNKIMVGQGPGLDPIEEDKPVPFPSGTRMLFDQDTPPTGWTRDITSTLDDRCVRIVIGTRAPDGGSWTISGLTQASHDHGGTASAGGHQHSSTVCHTGVAAYATAVASNPYGLAPALSMGDEGAFAQWTTRNPNLTNSAGAHTHTLTAEAPAISSNGTWRPLYRDVIVASKD